jgi:two-component system, OmpR family, sensor histidine kinase VicK
MFGLTGKKDKNIIKKSYFDTLADYTLSTEKIFSAIDDGVIIVDGQGIIRFMNQTATVLTGWDSETAVGLDCHAIMRLSTDGKDDYATTEHPVANALSKSASLHQTSCKLIHKSAKIYDIDLSVSVLSSKSVATQGAVVIFRDVTSQKQQEKSKAEFVSTASHEMRTPIAAVEGYISLALNSNVCKIDDKARDFLLKAYGSTQHLGQLFSDLLTTSKAEDGRLENRPQTIEISEYLGTIVNDLKFVATKKGLTVDFVLGTPNGAGERMSLGKKPVVRPAYYVYADTERLREVITNLFDNAVKYTPSGSIKIGVTGNHEFVQIFVQDTGLGIPKEDLPHLFQKFYRVDSTATREIGGTGLGLFLCKRIVDLYNGRIWADSTLGKGTTFYIDLPAYKQPMFQ